MAIIPGSADEKLLLAMAGHSRSGRDPLERAKALLAGGRSLADAALVTGIPRAQLDRMLWRSFGSAR